jgi:hypothetical protein
LLGNVSILQRINELKATVAERVIANAKAPLIVGSLEGSTRKALIS